MRPLAASVRFRAARRKESGGAVMFIVAMTLALLAGMGAYALTISANEVRTSGFIRQSMQVHYVSEWAVLGGTEELSLDGENQRDKTLTAPMVGCPSLVSVPTTPPIMPALKACRMLSSSQLVNPSFGTNWLPLTTTTASNVPVAPWSSATATGDLNIAVVPDFTVEFTDPVDLVAVKSDVSQGMVMQMMTVTAMGVLPPFGASTTVASPSAGFESARAHVFFGPIRKVR